MDLNSRLDISRSEHSDRSIEIIQTDSKEKMRKK